MLRPLTTRQSESNRRRVLIVDDDADIRDSLAEMFREEGFDVVTALNGLEALVSLNAQHRPDVMLLDLTMPVLDGQQVLANLRDRGLLDRLPVIIVSAVSFRPAPGAVAVVPKPVNFENLLGMVRQYCQ